MRLKINLLYFLLPGLFFVVGSSSEKALAQAQYDYGTVTYSDFYQDLAPYGQWISDPQYGYVWSPDVDGDFRPYYTNGHWVMTDYGNTWVSDYPWGWACFHYGRWTYDAYYGWLWIPGPNWGPAWVSWRYGESNYGWAPLGPGYDLEGDYTCPNDWWVFIPAQYIYSGQYYRYWYGPRNNKHYLQNTDFANNTFEQNHVTIVQGPRVKEVESATHQPVQVFKITNSRSRNTHLHNDVIKMYRPGQIQPAPPVEGRRPAPPNVVAAPQPVRAAQPVSGRPAKTPDFRIDVPKTSTDAPGTHFTEPPREEPRKNNTTNPYEWDVNRSIPQPQRDNPTPAETPRQTQRSQPAPQVRPAPQQAPQPAKQQQQPQPQMRPQPAPVQNRPQPMPQPAQRESRPAPAPQPQPRQEGRR